jgi:hypothetical protein
MDTFLSVAEKLSSERDAFLNEYHQKLTATTPKQNPHEKYRTKYDSETTFTKDELYDFGKNLKQSYLDVKPEDRKLDNFSGRGVPVGLSEFVQRFGEPDIHQKTMKRARNFGRSKHAKHDPKKSPEDNYQEQYFKCLEIIQEHQFQVQSIVFSPSKYDNRGKSSLCDDACVFEFRCQKNHYKFILQFEDDCDCDPGIFGLFDLENTINGEKCAGYCCDLYCQNTNQTRTNAYLQLIESQDISELKNKLFQKYQKLAEIFDAELVDLEPDRISKNDQNDLDFYLRLPNEKASLLLVPLPEKGDYVLYLSPANYQIKTFENSSSQSMPIQSMWEIYQYVVQLTDHYQPQQEFPFKMIYSSDDDVSSLNKMIQHYQDFLTDNYGYPENGIFFNRKQIQQTFKNVAAGQKSAKFYHNEDLMSGRDIDTKVVFTRETNLDSLMPISYHTELHYPLDQYSAHFLYQKGHSEMTCLISGRYQNADEIARQYYRNQKRDEPNFDPLTNYQPKHCEIAPSLLLKGSFTDIIDKVHKLFIDLFPKKSTNDFDDY